MSWVQRRRTETYYRRAKREGYRSRAVYKLSQIDEKFSLIRDGMDVLDLGASPGGWSQYISEDKYQRYQCCSGYFSDEWNKGSYFHSGRYF